MVTITIYTLTNPIDNTIFYIGKTSTSLNSRLSGHINDKDSNAAKITIISEIKSKGLLPIISEIEHHICEDDEQELVALQREGYWMKVYRENGHDLCSFETSPRLVSNHQKVSNKSKTPVGIRFNLDRLDFIKTMEGIESNQRVVDFLLDKYYWDKKLGRC